MLSSKNPFTQPSALIPQLWLLDYSLLPRHHQLFFTQAQHSPVHFLVVLTQAWGAASNAPGGLGHAEGRAWLRHTASVEMINLNKKLARPKMPIFQDILGGVHGGCQHPS